MVAVKKVPNRSRMSFLPKNVKRYISFENLIYDLHGKFVEGYDGGMYNMYKLDNGGFYMALDGLKKETKNLVNNYNYFESEMSLDAIGIAITLLALNISWIRTQDDDLCAKYQQLKELAYDHKECGKILAFLD